MKIETESLENRQAQLMVEVDEARLEKALHAAARRVARQIRVPGFRKGKAPYQMVENQVGRAALLDEAIDPLGQEVYLEALEQTEIEPYAPATLDDMQLEPMTFTFTVPLLPESDLGNYRKIRIKRKKVKVTKDEVREELEAMREQHAVLEPVERAIQMGDMVTFDFKATLKLDEDDEDIEPLFDEQGKAILIDDEAPYPATGFAREVVGMEAGEERRFSLQLPEDDFPEDELLVGKELAFEVMCTEVKARDLPKLDNDFAMSVGDYDNLKTLRKSVNEEIKSQKQRMADEEYADEVFDQIMENATLNYPPIMLDERIDRLMHDFQHTITETQNLTLDDYLKVNGKTIEELRGEFMEEATDNLHRALVLTEIVNQEKIAVSDNDVSGHIDSLVEGFEEEQVGLMREIFESPMYQETIQSSLLVEKMRDRLVAIASGKAPSLQELEAQQALMEQEQTDQAKDTEQTEEPDSRDDTDNPERLEESDESEA